nr:hypothetical protein [Myxococcota bacterium]
MSLFPVAPELRVRLPAAVHAGTAIVAEISIEAREAVRVEWIDAQLECTDQWSIGSGKSHVSRRETLLSLRARVFDGDELTPGTHLLRARFELPASLPPSFAHAWVKTETLIQVRASIPWWPDAVRSFVVPLRARSRPAVPVPYRGTNQESGRDRPRIELSLASSHLAARGVLSGAVAFFHHDASVVRGAYLALEAHTRLRARGGRDHVRQAVAYTVALPPELPVDGTPVPFRFRLPDDVAPNFASRASALEWRLVVQGARLFGTTTWLSVPVTVVESSELDASVAALELPTIGDARLEAVLEHTAGALGLSVRDGCLIGERGAVGVRITRTIRSALGNVLVAELALPRLGLGLSITRARMLPQLLQGDIEVGRPAFDAAYRVTARDPAQARALLGELAEVLGDTAIVQLDDERAVLEQADPSLDEASLDRFTRRALALAQALDAAIPTIVPPSGVDVDRDAWAEIARTLGGPFVAGDLSVCGSSGASEVAIETRFDRQGRATDHALRVRPAPALPADLA